MMKITSTLAVCGVIAILAGCASLSPEPVSVQPDVDAAIVATLPDELASALTQLDESTSECLTIVTLQPATYGVSAFQIEDALDLLREAGEGLGCQPVLRAVTNEGAPVSLEHLAKYLPVEARDGDILIN